MHQSSLHVKDHLSFHQVREIMVNLLSQQRCFTLIGHYLTLLITHFVLRKVRNDYGLLPEWHWAWFPCQSAGTKWSGPLRRLPNNVKSSQGCITALRLGTLDTLQGWRVLQETHMDVISSFCPCCNSILIHTQLALDLHDSLKSHFELQSRTVLWMLLILFTFIAVTTTLKACNRDVFIHSKDLLG